MAKSKRNRTGKRLQETIDADVAFLEKAIEGAPIGDPTDEEMAEICKAQRRVRARHIAEKDANPAPSRPPLDTSHLPLPFNDSTVQRFSDLTLTRTRIPLVGEAFRAKLHPSGTPV
jgi:hypothetical protein